MTKPSDVANAIVETLRSPNVSDSNFEPANVVDVLNHLGNGAHRIATAITPIAAAGTNASGGHIESLTEAVMGISDGLCAISESINHLAEAVERNVT